MWELAPGVAPRVYLHSTDREGAAIQTFGLADGPVQPTNERTRFFVGSITKEFTKDCMFSAVSEGAMTLDSDVRQWVPELDVSGITCQHLLEHRSGIRDYLAVRDLIDPYERQVLTKDAIFRWITATPTVQWVPGSRQEYSNSGYFLIAFILERLYGTTFERLLHDRVFTPHGMRDSIAGTYGPATNWAPPHGAGYGQQTANIGLQTIGDMGAWCSAPDLARFFGSGSRGTGGRDADADAEWSGSFGQFTALARRTGDILKVGLSSTAREPADEILSREGDRVALRGRDRSRRAKARRWRTSKGARSAPTGLYVSDSQPVALTLTAEGELLTLTGQSFRAVFWRVGRRRAVDKCGCTTLSWRGKGGEEIILTDPACETANWRRIPPPVKLSIEAGRYQCESPRGSVQIEKTGDGGSALLHGGKARILTFVDETTAVADGTVLRAVRDGVILISLDRSSDMVFVWESESEASNFPTVE